MQLPAGFVRPIRAPLAVRRRISAGGMGAVDERIMVGSLVNSISQVYVDVQKTLVELEPALAELSSSYSAYKANLTKIALQAMKLNPMQMGFMGVGYMISSALNAAKAVVAAQKAAQDQGVDYRKSHEALIAIADAVNQTEAATYAFRKITLRDLVGIGVLTERQGANMGTRAGYTGAHWRVASLEAVADGWAKKAGSSIPLGWIDVRFRQYAEIRTRLEKKITELAKVMRISDKVPTFKFADEDLAESIKGKLLDEMKKAHDLVRARHKPEGWITSTFNRAVEIAVSQPWLLIFGVAGIVFGHFMAPILKLDLGLTRTAFAASRLVQASAKIAAAGVTTYAATYKRERVDKGKTDAQAKEAATTALEKKVATVGKQEYNQAYTEIENYRNYAKVLKESLEGFLANLLTWLPWIGLGLGVLVVGGIILWRAVQPTQRIQVSA